MVFLLKYWQWILAVIVASILILTSTYYKGYFNGKKEAQAEQIIAQIKQDKKVRKKYDKIDKNTPFNANKSDSVDWLLRYTTP